MDRRASAPCDAERIESSDWASQAIFCDDIHTTRVSKSSHSKTSIAALYVLEKPYGLYARSAHVPARATTDLQVHLGSSRGEFYGMHVDFREHIGVGHVDAGQSGAGDGW